jgi:glycosidase
MATTADLLAPTREDDVRSVRALLERARSLGISYSPSPTDWRDEVLYFLLPDRFSDETRRPTLKRDEIAGLRRAPSRPGWSWHDWAESGRRWQGGTIKGIASRLDYLTGLGVTAIWVGPVFKQRARLDSYHGYGIQDFLDVDPRFGTRRDLIDLVAAAHQRQVRVILDVIVNHTGDNWGYVPPGHAASQLRNEPPYRPWPDHYGNPTNAETRDWRLAWRDESGAGLPFDAPIDHPEQGVWPRDLQTPSSYTRAGKGTFDHHGLAELGEPHAEHKRTDFVTLKDLALDNAGVLAALTDCYKYWIALSDCDGFRIDTVKHMGIDDARNFCGAIREFGDTIGKRNFLFMAEVAGGSDGQDFVLDNLGLLQRNMSAALDIGSARTSLTMAGKGLAPGRAYLEAFDEASGGFESHRAFGDRHVSILDDHDHVTGDKVRFSADIPDDSPVKDHQVVVPTAFQLFALGIPCIYYGTEQAFAGPAHSQRPFLLGEGWNDGSNGGDRFLREAMFGPEHPRAHHSESVPTQVSTRDTTLPGFGPFGTAGKEAFDPESPGYVRIAALCTVRADHPVLRLGRQYPRQIRPPGATRFDMPVAGQLVAWSRLLDTQEALVVVNPNGGLAQGADVVVSSEVSGPGTTFVVLANTAETAVGSQAFQGAHPVGSTLQAQGAPGQESFLTIGDLGAAEVLVLVKQPPAG